MSHGTSQKKKKHGTGQLQSAQAPAPKKSFNIAAYFSEVAALAKRVSWPSRKSTLTTTVAVLIMVALTCVFFLGVDQVIGIGIRALFKIGG